MPFLAEAETDVIWASPWDSFPGFTPNSDDVGLGPGIHSLDSFQILKTWASTLGFFPDAADNVGLAPNLTLMWGLAPKLILMWASPQN